MNRLVFLSLCAQGSLDTHAHRRLEFSNVCPPRVSFRQDTRTLSFQNFCICLAGRTTIRAAYGVPAGEVKVLGPKGRDVVCVDHVHFFFFEQSVSMHLFWRMNASWLMGVVGG